jgi:short-subunit dehydrogenase
MSDSDLVVFVTGASSGLGAALAQRLAKPGVKLVLQGRDTARLEATAQACRQAGAETEILQGDLADSAELTQLVDKIGETRLDEAYLCAGIGDMLRPGERIEKPQSTFAVASVNFTAAATLATSAAQGMLAQGRGRIVLVGSVAGAFALPMAPTYSASKAGLRIFAEALGDGLADKGVAVTYIALGFVDTPMSQRLTCWKPGMLRPEEAAGRIIEAARRNRRSVSIPAWFGPVLAAAGLVPSPLRRFVMARLDVDQDGRADK